MVATACSSMGVKNTNSIQQIDLRSDTVTRPSAGMYDAMMSAPVGDDVYGNDESVNLLEVQTARLLGKEAALFVSSGTQSNLIAMLTHCARGEEIIVGDDYHAYIAEARGASVLGGISLSPLAVDEQGSLRVDQVKAAIKPDNIHYPVSRLLCLENTVSGSVQAPENIKDLAAVARHAGLSIHLDGARLMNAVVALGEPAASLSEPFDSVSLCLSKGLGAPVGSVLSGSAEFIECARRHRKLLGGGMRQAGILAACGTYALEHNIERLAEDHANAELLAEGLAAIEGVSIRQQTNMVFLELPADNARELQSSLADQGILISAGSPSTRLVTHLDITTQDVERIVDAVAGFLKS